MKKIIEIIRFMIILYVSCIIVKMFYHHFVFDTQYLIDSLFTTIGVTLGWYGYEYVHNKINGKKNKDILQ